MSRMYRMLMSSFYWQSDLPEKRRQEIIDWVNSLDEDQRLMVDELRRDSTEAAMWDAEASRGE